jgi:hypothetical protein
MKKITKAKATPALSAPVPTKKKTKAVSSAKVLSPKVTRAAAAAVVPVPVPEVKKPASQPVPAPQPVELPKPTIIKIKAQIDVGFGNALTIRGSGAGLSWDKGLSMNCVNDDIWSITLVGVSGSVTFKFLVNDLTWSEGEDFVAQPGDEIILSPTF